MSIEDQIISEIKLFINKGNLNSIKGKWFEYVNEIDFGRVIAWDYVFQKVYLHAALKKQKHICDWLGEIFTQLNPIQQIALRQMFPYARHLLNND